MSQLSDWATKMKGHQDKIDAGLTGLGTDLTTLNDKIAALQASAGTVTPEDQALLDAIEVAGKAAADRVGVLDDLTPPPAPPMP